MALLTRRSLAVVAALAIAATVTSCSTPSDQPPTGGGGETATGLTASWDAKAATITLGTGTAHADLWFDAQCPHCKTFDVAQRAALENWATGSKTRVVLHPMVFLDRTSQGTKYSTRAATVLIAAARQNPDSVLPLMSALFDSQRPVGTAGFFDDELIDVAADFDVDATRDLRRRPYDTVLEERTAAAFKGPMRITGTPTLRFNGVDVPANRYGGDLTGHLPTPAAE